MAKISPVGERIENLRKAQGMTQAQFAEAVGVSQGRMSEWESGEATPSAEGYVKLAAQAGRSDPSEALFFWRQAGIGPEALTSVADFLLKGGEVQMNPILSTAEKILKDRMADQAALEQEGRVVLVPALPEGLCRIWQSGPPIPVAAKDVPNPASTYWVELPRAPYNDALSHGRLVIDVSDAKPMLFSPFRDRVVLAHFVRVAGVPIPYMPSFPMQWPEGFLVRSLQLWEARGGEYAFVLAPQDRPRRSVMAHDVIAVWSFRPEYWLSEEWRGLPGNHIRRGTKEYRLAFEEAVSTGASCQFFPQGFEIIGEVRAWYPGA